MKDSFLLYYDQKEIWELLSPEQCKELILAIYNFQENKNPELSPVVRIASVSIFKQMLRDASKWELIKEKRARAGRIGGLVSSKQANASSGNSSKSSKRVANQAVTVTDTVINNKIPPKKTSKNSHTPCTDEELQQIAIDLQVPFSSVSNKHAEIMDKVRDGSFSKYGKTVYYTLRNWIRMGLRDGKIQKTQEAQIKEMYGLS